MDANDCAQLNKKTSKAGFSLLEVLVSMSILGIAVVGLSARTYSEKGNSSAIVINHKNTQLAKTIVNQLASMYVDDFKTFVEGSTEVNSSPSDPYSYVRLNYNAPWVLTWISHPEMADNVSGVDIEVRLLDDTDLLAGQFYASGGQAPATTQEYSKFNFYIKAAVKSDNGSGPPKVSLWEKVVSN